MIVNITLVGSTELVAKLDAMPAVVRRVLLAKVNALTLKLEARVKAKLTNDVLNVQTGALRRSIFSTVDDTQAAVTGRVRSSGDVKYARIHEYGGVTPPHDIVPVKAKALAFVVGGKQVFAKIVHHPGSKMPERSYLRSSLADMRNEIITGLRSAVVAGMNQAVGHAPPPGVDA